MTWQEDQVLGLILIWGEKRNMGEGSLKSPDSVAGSHRLVYLLWILY